MPRCGCATDQCACLIQPGTGIAISGLGSQSRPYVISAESAEPEGIDGIVGALIATDGSDTQAAGDSRWVTPVAAGPGNALVRDGGIIRGRLLAEGIRYAALGDSTESGVGWASAPNYGEANCLTQYSGPTVFALGLMRADPNFVEPDPAVFTVTDPSTAASGAVAPVPFHSMVVSTTPSLSYTAKQVGSSLLNELTVYYIERTADTAPRFDVVASGTTTVDSYVGPLTYSGSVNVLGRLRKATVACPATRSVTFTINNLTLVDRGSGVAADGTLAIVGFTFGKGVDYRNFAVSSSTLLNASAANTTRGITTDDRFAAAVAMNANVVSMGWGTNDSKVGVSTVAAFKADYTARIAALRADLPDVVVILSNDPPGLASPYNLNPAYNQAVREIAAETRSSLIDVTALMQGRTAYYNDDVHPNPAGYTAIGGETLNNLGFSQKPLTLPIPLSPRLTTSLVTPEAAITGNVADLVSRVTTNVPTLYIKRTGSGNTGWHILAGDRATNVTLSGAGTTINRDTTSLANLTLNANSGPVAFSNSFLGDYLTVIVIQGTGGSRTLSWNSAFKFSGNVAPTLSTAVGAVDVFYFIHDGTNYRERGRSLGQS